MFGNFMKNKALCFLLTTAALCPSKEAKSASDIVMDEKIEDASAETVEINGMPFYFSVSDEKSSKSETGVLPLNTKETEEVQIGKIPFLIEKVGITGGKNAVNSFKEKWDDLVEASESSTQPVELPAQSFETSPSSKEEIHKTLEKTQELKSDNPDSLQKVSLGLKEDETLCDKLAKTEAEFTRSSNKYSEEDEIPLSDIQVNKALHPDDSLITFQNLDEEIETKNEKVFKITGTRQENSSKYQRKFKAETNKMSQDKKIVSQDKKIATVVGGILMSGLTFIASMMIFGAPSSRKNHLKKIISTRYSDEDSIIRGFIKNTLSSEERLKSVKSESKKDEKLEAHTPVIELKEHKDEKLVSDTGSKQAETVQQPSENTLAVSDTKIKPFVSASEKKKVSESNSEDFSDIILSKNPHELFQWLCAVKSIYEIQKERAVLRREMALAKKEDNQNNQKEKDRINARRKVLNAKRRAACFRANSREMQAIKDLRRELTRKMTLAKRGKHMDAATREIVKEEVMRKRWSLRQRVKELNGQIKAFDYAKQWRSFLAKYKQSRQAA